MSTLPTSLNGANLFPRLRIVREDVDSPTALMDALDEWRRNAEKIIEALQEAIEPFNILSSEERADTLAMLKSALDHPTIEERMDAYEQEQAEYAEAQALEQWERARHSQYIDRELCAYQYAD